jgi:hypothetical protein
MACRLVFNDPGIYRMMYEGFLVTAKAEKPNEHRLVDKILTQLESIGMEDPSGAVVPGFDPKDPVSPRRRDLVRTHDGILILEDAEFAFLKRSLENISCNAVMSRQVTRLFDFLDSAERGDAKALAKTSTA